MTEKEWLGRATGPYEMIEFLEPRFLRGELSSRKSRLLACAIYRYVWDSFLFESEEVAHGLEVGEQFADGEVSRGELDGCRPHVPYYPSVNCNEALDATISTSQRLLHETLLVKKVGIKADYSYRTGKGAEDHPRFRAAMRRQSKIECGLVRCVLGNPFRHVSVDPSSLTTTVITLAEAIYGDRAFDRMPILADALEDAGCTNQGILAHCRQEGEHVRGCWVIDLLTGRQ
jgi:hypothetical protein